MTRNTLALAYAARTAKAAQAPTSVKAPPAFIAAQVPQAPMRAQPEVRPAAVQPAGPFNAPPPAPLTAPRPAFGRRAPSQPHEAIMEDALLIAVRRSLASCRDSSQRRMLAAFEAKR